MASSSFPSSPRRPGQGPDASLGTFPDHWRRWRDPLDPRYFRTGDKKSTDALYRTKQTMKAEKLLAKLNELRHEAEGDETDIEWLTLHHAFCFISYKMGEFQKYLDEVAKGDE
ncbi:hypothetical protein B7486_15515 [cyanobacterium TDX16]|nr:hypothetical protein B7486_15515 [cyanobacterium TDX16]